MFRRRKACIAVPLFNSSPEVIRLVALTYMRSRFRWGTWKNAPKRHGSPEVITNDDLRRYGAATDELGCRGRQAAGRRANNRVESGSR